MVERVKFHHELSRFFVTHLDKKEVNLTGITFTLSPIVISEVIGIPDVFEKWNKGQDIDREYYEPYIKVRYKEKLKRVFPFKFLEGRFAPLMKIIIRYFTCEGMFS